MNITIKYDAPPTVGDFMRSDAFFRLIAGPVGSGKTTGCIFELLRRASEQAPAPNGVRYTRFAIVRQTLKQLKDTVLKDIEQWLHGLVNYKVSDSTIYINVGDIQSEWLLIPLDSPEDQRRLLSMQLTGAWMSEAIEMNPDLVPALSGRCGRYPSKVLGSPTWFGIIADTNMPSEGDPWHKLMDLEVPPDWQIFVQPGGLEGGAENIENLPGGREYYERLSRGHSPEWVQRYVHARYGSDPSGSAVFKDTFRKNFHTVARGQGHVEGNIRKDSQFALEPVHGYPLIITQDFGRNPCSLICQIDHRGRGLILEELVAEDMGLELHIRTNLVPALNKERYLGRQFYVVGDPAGRARSSSYEETSFDLLKRSGLRAFPAPTNDIDKRLRSVDSLLLQQRDGAAALLIDADQCPSLVLALQSRYRYSKRRNGQLSPLPEKLHPWSDLADCLQYFCLVVQGGMHEYVANRMQAQMRVTRGDRPRVSAAGWT